MENKKSLYRLYRPGNFTELAGHNNLKEILISQLKNNNFSNALLFTGQRGTGKTSLAKIFAKSVNCSRLVDNYNPCNSCDLCVSINNNSNPDFFEIDAASNNGVEEIRNIKNNTSLLPVYSKYKVFIIDEVHMLSNSAFNALLKTLEEPPKHVIFILATTEYFKIPQTIISRCQVFNFKKIEKNDLEKRLLEICKVEKITIDSEALSEIFYMSDGSLRDSLNFLEQAMTISNENISIDHLKKVFSITSKEEKIKILKDILIGDSESLIDFFENGSTNGIDFDSLCLSLLNILKELIEFKLTKNSNYLNVMNLDDIKIFENHSIDNFFVITKKLSDVYEKTKNGNISFQFLLITILETLISLQTNKDIIVSKENDQKNLGIVTPIKTLEYKLSDEEEKKIEENIKQSFIQNNEPKNMNEFLKIKLEQIIKENAVNMDEVVFNDDQILGILSSANKITREAIQNKFNNFFEVDENNNIKNINMTKKYVMFLENKVVAANENGCLIVCETRSNAKFINNKLKNEKFRNEFFEDIEMEIAILAIDKIKFKNIRKEYELQKNNNSLETLNRFNISEFYTDSNTKYFEIENENEYLKRLIDLLGKENVKVE